MKVDRTERGPPNKLTNSSLAMNTSESNAVGRHVSPGLLLEPAIVDRWRRELAGRRRAA
jgi:hypothetical protein